MIVWLSGAFGGGKTSTAQELAGILPDARQFDPEWVGYMLRANLGDQQFSDFQQLPPWRSLVPVVMREVTVMTGQHLIAPQTVLVARYWQELRRGLDEHRLPVFHVLLHARRDVLEARIRADKAEAQACQWRLGHLDEFEAAWSWLEPVADLIVDSTSMSATSVAGAIAAAVTPVLDRDRVRSG